MDTNTILFYLLIFGFTFCWMEWAAWALHKYVMHGFLWWVHEDHHVIRTDRKWQKNDFFAFFFAVPSFLLILSGTYWASFTFAVIGYGIMAYGAVYFTVHEVIIHRRWKFLKANNWYTRALTVAHKHHHLIDGKEGCSNFGMLVVPLRYFGSKKVAAPKLKPSSERQRLLHN